jgi:acyl-CoA reductase-like NAD-dependent aldehyde dehydrogenase
VPRNLQQREHRGLRDAWIDFQENGADEDYEESVGAVDTKTGSRSPRGVIEILERLYTLLEQSDDKLAMRETDDLITALTETSLNRETKPELAASIRELWDAFEDGSEEASLCSEAAEALGAINVDDYNGI